MDIWIKKQLYKNDNFLNIYKTIKSKITAKEVCVIYSFSLL